MNRGYFGIGIYSGKTAANVGTLWRSAHNFGAAFIFTVLGRYQKQPCDTTKAWRSVPMTAYVDVIDFFNHIPSDCKVVGIEQIFGADDLRKAHHPERAVYVLGGENCGLDESIISRCDRVFSINTPMCLNVAVAGSIVMYDRSLKV